MSLRPARRREAPAPHGAFRLLPSATAACAPSRHTLSEVVAVGWRQRAVAVHRAPGAPTGAVVSDQTQTVLAERRDATQEDIDAWIEPMITEVVDQSNAIREELFQDLQLLTERGHANNVIINKIAGSLPVGFGTIEAWYRLEKKSEEKYEITTDVALHTRGMQDDVILPGNVTLHCTATKKVPMTVADFNEIDDDIAARKDLSKHVVFVSKMMNISEDSAETILRLVYNRSSDEPPDAAQLPDELEQRPSAAGPHNKFTTELYGFQSLLVSREPTIHYDFSDLDKVYEEALRENNNNLKAAGILTRLHVLQRMSARAVLCVDIMETIRSTVRTCLTHIVGAPDAPRYHIAKASFENTRKRSRTHL